MKKPIVVFFVFLISGISSFAQVGIGTTTPNASAKLQVDATDKGFLPPRVSLTATNDLATIPSPATGLLIYNTATAGTSPNNVTPGFYFYDGSKWQRLISQQPDATVNFDKTTPTTTGVTFTPNTPASQDYVYVSSVDNSQWTYNGSNYVTYTPPPSTAWYSQSSTNDAGSNKTSGIYRNGNVGIGDFATSSLNASAKLQVDATDKGFLPPRMTSTQRDAITSPADGLIIYNTTNNRLEVSSASSWRTLVTLNGTDSLSNKTLKSPTISTTASSASTVGAGAIAYNTSSGGVLQYSNGVSWNTLSSTVQKTVVTGYFSGSYAPSGLRVLTCTETQDRNGDFSGNTFTSPRTGLYLVTVNLLTTQKSWNAGEELNIGIYQSGTSIPYFLGEFFAQASVTTYGGVSTSCVVALTSGQQVNFQMFNSGSVNPFSLYGQNYNQFSITEL